MIKFRPAVRKNVGLVIGLIGPSGSGKTYTAMQVAAGIVGKGGRFAVIDTENDRALHYADMFEFDHWSMEPPFRPEKYLEAFRAADKAGYGAIVGDSMTHEWAGDGGVLDWHEELFRSKGSREKAKMSCWIEPKRAHKKMVQEMLRLKAHLILCFRAEEKVKMVKNPKTGKQDVVPIGWQPICEKNLPYEMTCSLRFDAEKPDDKRFGGPGFPIPIKLQEQHKHMFPVDKKVSEESGRLIAEWASGGSNSGELKRIIGMINDADSKDQLTAVIEEVKKLSEGDRQVVRGIYKARLIELEKPAEEKYDYGPPPMTDGETGDQCPE